MRDKVKLLLIKVGFYPLVQHKIISEILQGICLYTFGDFSYVSSVGHTSSGDSFPSASFSRTFFMYMYKKRQPHIKIK